MSFHRFHHHHHHRHYLVYIYSFFCKYCLVPRLSAQRCSCVTAPIRPFLHEKGTSKPPQLGPSGPLRDCETVLKLMMSLTRRCHLRPQESTNSYKDSRFTADTPKKHASAMHLQRIIPHLSIHCRLYQAATFWMPLSKSSPQDPSSRATLVGNGFPLSPWLLSYFATQTTAKGHAKATCKTCNNMQ